MAKQNISLSVIKRLPKYYRYLESINEKGIIRVSSKELSEITGLTASQIRQDLNHFGCFGQQGYNGYISNIFSFHKTFFHSNKFYQYIISHVNILSILNDKKTSFFGC